MASINEKFIVNLKGKDFVTYEGLLDLAHQKGLIGIDIEIIQIPGKENDMTAIVKAIAKTDKEVFVDIGDASPRSVNSMIQPHIIRMASTRAKARALRDLTNVGMTALEEIMEDEAPAKNSSKNQPGKVDKDKQAIVDNSLASDKQLNYIDKLLEDKGYSVGSLIKYMEREYEKTDLKALTKQEASLIIKMLNEV